MIAHARMESIVSPLRHGKPILIMPWHGELGETRHDHLIDDVRRFDGRRGISVAEDEAKITPMLDHLGSASGSLRIPGQSRPEPLAHTRNFALAVSDTNRSPN